IQNLLHYKYLLQFCSGQCHKLLSHSDIISEQLHRDIITEQQHFMRLPLDLNLRMRYTCTKHRIPRSCR
ncbi:hypothetical protein FE781_15790, partial [Paenibacillus thermoaerophilus]